MPSFFGTFRVKGLVVRSCTKRHSRDDLSQAQNTQDLQVIYTYVFSLLNAHTKLKRWG